MRGETPAILMDKDPSFQDVVDMMALLHKQNMEMLDKIITLKTIETKEVKDEVSD